MVEEKTSDVEENIPHQNMRMHYVLIFVNAAILLSLFTWISLDNSKEHNKVREAILQIRISNLVLDKLMLGLSFQQGTDYAEINAQKEKLNQNVQHILSLLDGHLRHDNIKDYKKVIARIADQTLQGIDESLLAHTGIVTAHYRFIHDTDKLIQDFLSYKGGETFAYSLSELKEKIIKQSILQTKAAATEAEEYADALGKLLTQTVLSNFLGPNTITPEMSAKLIKVINLAEEKVEKHQEFSQIIGGYSSSEQKRIFNTTYDHFHSKLIEHKDQIRFLIVLFCVLLMGALLHIVYMIYEIQKRNVHIVEQAEQLRESLNKQVELNDLQRKFVSMVSHEFRTPLAIIDSGAQKMIRRADALAPSKIKDLGLKIRSHINKLIELLDSTLHSQRMEAGAMELMPGPCDLKLIIGDVCQLQYEVHTRNIIQLEISELPNTITADAKLITHVVTNLVSNAVKYSPDGTEVKVIGRDKGDTIELEIQDKGVGIPKEEMADLFSCFYRASTSIGISGTGIGLHLVKNIVDRHGGQIEVTSEVGEGSTFLVRLPKEQSMEAGESSEVMDKVA